MFENLTGEEIVRGNNLNQYIDHTLLKPEAKEEDIQALCKEANLYDFYSVCVNPCFIPLCKNLLKPNIKICTVIDFPLGASLAKVKAFETEKAIQAGAHEVDMVIPIGLLKSRNDAAVAEHIQAVVKSAKNRPVKVIIETCLLTEAEKIKACELITLSNADYIKTSTGFSTSGAQIEDIALFKNHIGAKVKIKASGGIRTFKQAQRFLQVGCDRIGTNSSVAIIKEAKQ